VKDLSRLRSFLHNKTSGKGTGLGLSICYGIITEHGGTIQVRNVPARGASFIIQLPHQPTASLSFSMPDQKAIPARDGRILLVDYDDSVLEAVGTILSARGHRVQTARSIHEAGALIEKEDFDLIVADLHISDGTSGGGLSGWLARHKPGTQQKINLDVRCGAL